jgi:hypothetical protein
MEIVIIYKFVYVTVQNYYILSMIVHLEGELYTFWRVIYRDLYTLLKIRVGRSVNDTHGSSVPVIACSECLPKLMTLSIMSTSIMS